MPVPKSTPIGQIVRPASGWLRAVRGALDLTLAELAHRLKVTPPAVRSFEQAEADDRITLASLRRVAAAMDCDLIYALVPRAGAPLPGDKFEPHAPGRTESAVTSSPPAPDTQDSAKKVTDLTWRTLHGES